MSERTNSTGMTLIQAFRHLQERVVVIAQADSRARPRWREDDLNAVLRLLERPAMAEQIALARIEGTARTAQGSIYQRSDAMGDVLMLARTALGLK